MLPPMGGVECRYHDERSSRHVENPSLQEADVLTQAMKDLAEEFPELMRPLIQERDEYMVFLLRALASR